MKPMKIIFCSALLFLYSILLLAQVSENKSGIMQFNISKKGNEAKQFKDDTRMPADDIPPLVTIQSPLINNDSLIKVNSKILAIRGKVQDDGGIFEVLVNGIEAKVGDDGTFIAEVPVAIGKNTIKIQATDVSMNRRVITLQAERTADLIAAEVTSPKIVSVFSINLISPVNPELVTASNKIKLQACVKSDEPLTKLVIFRNGSFVNGYLSRQLNPSEGCAFRLDEDISLRLGLNEIKIEAYTQNDTVSKAITVEYSLYAARNYALLIGNEKYDDPAIMELSEPLKDATELYNILTKEYNFNPEDVIFLKNPTKAEIIGTLHQLRSKITPEDNFLIFYAGHGYWDEGMGVGYWLPRDASKSNPVNWLPNTDLTNYLGAIKSKHTLLIADACFSGGIFKTRSAFSNEFAVELLYQLNSRKAITSGTLTEVPDRSVFFQYLIKNLRENTSDYLSSEELFSKMRMAVINNSQNVPQFGTIQNVGDEGGDFIFIRRKK